ncbi:hypothetical protein VPHK251G3_0047 [Vibrio phage K251 g3]
MSNPQAELIRFDQCATIVQAKMSDMGIIKTCRNCENVDLAANTCKLYNQTPPITVVTTGCPEWQLYIPF